MFLIDDFRRHFTDFLFDIEGARSRSSFRWYGGEKVVCGEMAPDIEAAELGTFLFLTDKVTSEARGSIESAIAAANLSSHTFSDCEVR